MENLVRDIIIRASFSQEKMTYIPKKSKIIYQSTAMKNEYETSVVRIYPIGCGGGIAT
jgi:hypothetical protein